MEQKKNSLWKLPLALGAAAGLGALCLHQNNRIAVSSYRCSSHKLPAQFQDYVIVQVSDLHNKLFGKNQTKLLGQVALQKPDCIVITGDLVDSRRTNIAKAMAFIHGAVRLAPVYYVPGNHEGRIAGYRRLREDLLRAGVTLLEDTKLMLARQGACIELLGLRDWLFLPPGAGRDAALLEKRLAAMTQGEDGAFRLLLSHRPELLPLYQKCGVDLALCGHAHGGQFRLGRLGFYAPGQGVFPKYTAGIYTQGATAMIVSRGLGNSQFPLRLNNPPELVKITLHRDAQGAEEA